MKLYTKTGDKGQTSLIGNERVEKCDARVEAYGTMDELNAYLGLVKTMKIPDELKVTIEKIQKNIFQVSAFLACSSEEMAEKFDEPDEEFLSFLENEIDDISYSLPKKFNFSIPANNELSAHLNICRTICRRAERRIIAINENFHERDYTIKFVNRLSDYLYALYLKFD